jgi:hypothetical protein
MSNDLPAPYGLPFALADAIVTPLLRGAARTAIAAARALHRAYCVRSEKRAASLLGIPTPDDVRAVWAPPRRSLQQALLIGSKLVDLTPSHPNTLRRAAPDARGRPRLAGRDGGLKRYFATALPDLPYPTAMRYRRLALRLLRTLDTPTAIPLEWLLSSAPADSLATDASLVVALRDGRRQLWRILDGVRSQRELSRWLDRQPTTDRLPAADFAQESALRDELLRRGEEKLAAALASGRRLTPAEKRAFSLLKRLRTLAEALAKR